MIRILLALPLAALLSSTAQATTWADYEEAFPAFPCMDGWMACYQGGDRVTPDLQRRSSMPSPANARVDWFSLEPTSGFSPFVGLTSYSMGGTPAPAPAVAEVDPMPEPFEAPDPEPFGSPDPEPFGSPDPAPVDVAPRPEPSMVRPDPEPSMVRPDPEPSLVRPDPEPSLVRPDPEPSMVRPGSQPPGMVRPGPDPQPEPQTVNNITVVQPDPEPVQVAVVAEPEPSGMVRPEPTPPDVGPVTCDDLVRLESSALIGRLNDEQVACLEASFADVARQTEKKKISLLLIANANGKGDKRAWEGLVRRHLQDIDQSDPDLCYAYATHLARKGPGRAESVIRWSEVALENRTRWVGETYKSRVYNLYKLRAAAANTLWERAEAAHAEAQTDETESAVERTRGRLKTYAREWYEYAKEAGKDTTVPRQLCVSAAGTSEFCEGR